MGSPQEGKKGRGFLCFCHLMYLCSSSTRVVTVEPSGRFPLGVLVNRYRISSPYFTDKVVHTENYMGNLQELVIAA
ncbi:hypothetical protein GOP47_0020013 [Adiantum capillus-veneris]|uniref:Secreted protein n=1 Tax=Adiantum capillus-veneris TaxID=13818 RepID=A0A9D4Z7L1_ADICA|nr:hypothetical protein GOP47_0020013 [Adiantum capillus-veneris]